MGAVASLASCTCCAIQGISCISCCGRTGVSLHTAKIFYALQIALAGTLALILHAYGSNINFLIEWSAWSVGCTNTSTDTHEVCFGNQFVYRISFATVCYFLSIGLFSLLSIQIHVGWWGLKLLWQLLLMVLSMLIPFAFYNTYVDFATVASAIFLVLSVIVLIDFGYTLQDWASSKIDTADEAFAGEPGCCSHRWRIGYLLAVVLLWFGPFIIVCYLLHFSTGNNALDEYCGASVGFLVVTLLAGVILTVLSVIDRISPLGARGLLPPAVVFTYITWLAWQGIHNSPTVACDPLSQLYVTSAESESTTSTVFGILITVATLTWTSYSATDSVPGVFQHTKQAEQEQAAEASAAAASADAAASSGAHAPRAKQADETLSAALLRQEEARAAGADGKVQPGSEPDTSPVSPARSAAGAGGVSPEHVHVASAGNAAAAAPAGVPAHTMPKSGLLVFHVVMALAGMYMAMLLTNWSVDADSISSRHSSGAQWAAIGAQWATIVLYLWSLLAPAILKNRDFS